LRNQMQIFFVTIVLFLFFLNNFFSLLNIQNQKFFYFFRLTKNFNLFLLDLGLLGDFLLQLKEIWKYLRFIFNKKLSFNQHIHFYFNKALLTVKDMKMQEDSTSSLLLSHKYLLYCIYIMPIALYRFLL